MGVPEGAARGVPGLGRRRCGAQRKALDLGNR